MDLKVDQLKEMCRTAGLKVSGSKSNLIDRLREHDSLSIAPAITSPRIVSDKSNKKLVLSDDDLLPELSGEPIPDFSALLARQDAYRVENTAPLRDRSVSRGSPSQMAKEFGPLGHDYSRSVEDTSDINKIPGGLAKVNSRSHISWPVA